VVSKALYPSTNPEILVMIGPADSENQPVESRPLKKIKNTEKILAKYISLPSGLKSQRIEF